MSGHARASLLAKVLQMLGRQQPEHSLRDSIAELVQEAAEAQQVPGELPELDRQERALIANVLRLRETNADDVMVPRADIVAMRLDVTLEQALEQLRAEGHSRLPVYGEQLDDIVGMIHIKDVFLSSRKEVEAVDLRTLARPLLTVTDQTPLEVLLAEFQRRRNQAALVLDNRGAWIGFITMEDIIEEIIGTVDDEFAVEPPPTLADVLSLGRIVLDIEAESLGEAIRLALARVPAAELPLRADAIARAVMERERLASTYLGKGLAMPHARLPGLEKPVLLVVRSTTGIPVEGTTERARLLFVLLTPAGQPRVHQKLQARIAELLENSDYVEQRLHKATSSLEMLDVIRTGEQAAID